MSHQKHTGLPLNKKTYNQYIYLLYTFLFPRGSIYIYDYLTIYIINTSLALYFRGFTLSHFCHISVTFRRKSCDSP